MQGQSARAMRGRRVTVGLPGTGISWTEQPPPARVVHGGRLALIIVVAAIVDALLAAWLAGS
jgi:hypothetical protein